MYWADLRLKFNQFIRKYTRIIIIALIAWAAILLINSFLKDYQTAPKIKDAVDPHSSIVGSVETVPNNLKEPITECIDTYFNYCKNKDYESAYNMILDGCKQMYFPTLNIFKGYVDRIFNGDKIYYIQNYSNYQDSYIYQIRIFDDIMKTGMTGQSDIKFYEEKVTVQQIDGELKLGLRQYIASKAMDDVYEDDYLKIWIDNKDVFYEQEVYT